MKKLFFAAALLFGSVGMYSCGGEEAADTTATEEVEGVVIDTDTAVSEIEVERTVMEVDTTVETESETVEVENEIE